MSENDKIDPEANAEGNSKVEAPEEGNAGKEEEKKEESLSLEEMTYKERYARSQKEVQEKLLPQLKAARSRLGLSDEDIITLEEEKEKEDDDDDVEDEKEEKDEAEVVEKKEEARKPEPSGYEHYQMVEPGEETAMDIIWDGFLEKHPDVESDPIVRENIIREFKRFRFDSLGNRLPLKKALEDTYFWANRDNYIKKLKETAKNEGIIEATKNKEGVITETSSKNASFKKTITLSDREKEAAKKMGISEEVYLKNKIVYDEDDDE